ncbi:MAG: hypothetical protein M1819_006064 [Sarea resinae]|nr:MAG: hypothetical protein M1819_006064 [Sarea resinae]
MTSSPPLRGIRVLELAGLAPVPFAGLLLADYGASVLRIDRPNSTTPSRPPPPAQDLLTRHKASIPIDLKSPSGISFLKSLIPHVDVLLDPFRPGVLEKLGLCPATVLQPLNPRLVVGRLTGFRPPRQTQRRQMTPAASHASDQDAYSSVAGHDINYLALSGVLSLSGRAGEKPYAPGNLVADFGGGGMMLVTGILMALLARERGDNASPLDESSDRGPQQHSNFGLWQGKTKAGEKGGLGQIVQANMVDGSAYLASMPLLVRSTELWNRKRGENMFDGGCPWYDTYETKEGGYVAV